MKTKSFLACFIVVMMATSVAVAGGHHGGSGGGFARGGTGSFHGSNWNHCHGGHSSFVFIGGFPSFGYPYGYGYGYPYGYGYYPYGYGSGYYGYGPGYYGYGSGHYGNGYYKSGYYGNGYYGYNSHQSSVARLQRQLARAGYYRGSIDGIMGPRTRYAWRAYQHDHGTASL